MDPPTKGQVMVEFTDVVLEELTETAELLKEMAVSYVAPNTEIRQKAFRRAGVLEGIVRGVRAQKRSRVERLAEGTRSPGAA